MSNITLYSLSDYNNGELIPFTIQLDGLTEDDYRAEIEENLERITEEKEDGETREEWIVCDYEDIPSNYVGEYDIDSDFFELMEAIDNSCYDADVFYAAIDCDVELCDVEEAYSGQYKDDEDFAYEMADQCGQIDHDAGWPMNCIDWERAARDLMYDYKESDGHYFRCL